jgi:hypothetical protein
MTAINGSHPLTQGLIGYWLAPDAGPQWIEQISGKPSTPQATPFGQLDGPYGRGQSFNGSSDFQTLDGYLTQPPLPITVMAIVYPTSFAAQRPVFTNAERFATNYCGLRFHIDTLASLYTWYGDNTGTGNSNRNGIFSASSVVAANTWQIISTTARNAADFSQYVNGILLSGTTFGTGGAMVYPAGSVGTIGYDNPSGGLFAGGVVAVAVWRRNLTDAEHMQLVLDPFAVFTRPPEYGASSTPTVGLVAPFIPAATITYMPSLGSGTTVSTQLDQAGAISVG